MSFRDSPITERLRDACIMGSGSGVVTGLHQLFVGNNIQGILHAGGSEGVLGFMSSSFNLWLYNTLKQKGQNHTPLTDQQIIGLSVILISVGSVGLSRYIMHLHIHSKSPESIATFYVLGNMAYMYLYETVALKNNFINKVSANIKDLIASLRRR